MHTKALVWRCVAGSAAKVAAQVPRCAPRRARQCDKTRQEWLLGGASASVIDLVESRAHQLLVLRGAAAATPPPLPCHRRTTAARRARGRAGSRRQFFSVSRRSLTSEVSSVLSIMCSYWDCIMSCQVMYQSYQSYFNPYHPQQSPPAPSSPGTTAQQQHGQQQQQHSQHYIEAAASSPPSSSLKSQEGSPNSPPPSCSSVVLSQQQHSSKLVRNLIVFVLISISSRNHLVSFCRKRHTILRSYDEIHHLPVSQQHKY